MNDRSTSPLDALKGFGRRLKGLRTQRRLSQKQLGTKAGCSGRRISRYERGTTLPPLPVLVLLREALRVPLDLLVRGVPTLEVRDPQEYAVLARLMSLPKAERRPILADLDVRLPEPAEAEGAPARRPRR